MGSGASKKASKEAARGAAPRSTKGSTSSRSSASSARSSTGTVRSLQRKKSNKEKAGTRTEKPAAAPVVPVVPSEPEKLGTRASLPLEMIQEELDLEDPYFEQEVFTNSQPDFPSTPSTSVVPLEAAGHPFCPDHDTP
ncbi:unnamed protein product [Durusdinium trenchii]|uniref:Uncharacterized protein n=2 Tax=Durusdinium trenchii TaxID=1381693 RepID=A0ABP0N2B1_9DINO